MPTYEYRCDKCQTVFEVFQSIKSPPLRRAKCETCGKVQPVRRLIGTGGAVLFKGSGFYQTDYRSESYHKAAKAETTDTKAPASESKSDSAAKPTDATTKEAPTKSVEATKESAPSNKVTSAEKASSAAKRTDKPASRRKK